MKKNRRVVLVALLLISSLLISSLLIAAPTATADPDGGTILWKQDCPWRATIQVMQDGRDLLVYCITTR